MSPVHTIVTAKCVPGPDRQVAARVVWAAEMVTAHSTGTGFGRGDIISTAATTTAGIAILASSRTPAFFRARPDHRVGGRPTIGPVSTCDQGPGRCRARRTAPGDRLRRASSLAYPAKRAPMRP